MDAAHITLKKTALFLAFALLCLGSWSSRANAQSLSTCGSVSLTSQTFQAQCNVSSTGAAVTFAGSISYSDSVTGWLSVSSLSSQTTPATLVVGLGNAGILDANPGTHSATITLTPTAPSGATGATISVTYTPGAGGGGGGNNGGITASSLSAFCPTCTAVQYLTLTTTSATAISYVINNVPYWLSVYPVSGSVSSSSPATITIYVNYFSAAASTNLTVNYNNTSTNVPITISSSGGGGSGTISPNTSNIAWSYASGGQLPSAQTVSFTDSAGATYWSASVTFGGDPTWLSLTYNGANEGIGTGFIAFNGSTSASFGVQPFNSGIASLSNGTHTATITINDTSSSTAATVNVTINVNGSSGGSGALTVSPSSITLPTVAIGATSTVQSSATITSNSTGSLSYSLSNTCTGIYLSFSSTSLVAGGAGVSLTVYGSPNGISSSAFTDNCNLALSLLSSSNSLIASVNVPISWTIGSGSGGGGGGSSSSPVLPTSLTFASQNGSTNSLVGQLVTINTTGAWTASTSYTSSQSGWISVATSGAGPGTTPISIFPANLGAGTYTGTVTFSNGGQVTVTLLISSSTPVLYASPYASFNLLVSSGSIIGNIPTFQVLASDGSRSPINISTSQSWLVLSTPATGNTGDTVSASINPASLANGVYVATINITDTSVANTPLAVPVVLTVTGSSSSGGGSLTFSTSAMTFNAQANGATPAAQSLTVTAPSSVYYSASASGVYNNITWLSISPSNNNYATYEGFTVYVNQAGLPLGNYAGYLNFTTAGGGSQSVQVTLNVTTSGTTAALSASPTSLSFSAVQNGAAPATQSLSISSTSGSTAVSFNVTTTVQSGSINWLSATASSFTTPSTVTVSVQTALSPGNYSGTVVLTPTNGGAILNVPVTLAVTGLPTISASPTSLPLTYIAGGTSPTGTIAVNGGAGLNYLASVTSTCNCIAVSPASGNTTSSPAITVSLTNTSNLTAGSYTGTITVSGTNGSTGNTSITVTLTVTAPLPTISAVANAANGVNGVVSPGEIVSIFAPATNPIGPATGVGLSSSNLVNGNVPTTGLGGVSVTFNGRPAAVIYASATQVNAVVPYGVAGFNNFPVIVSYLGQTSNGYTLSTATTVPGIFTQNAAGTGPADVLNSDGRTVNGPTTPAAKGSIVSVYMTGEGAITPKGVDGQVTCSAGCSSLSQIPVPLLPVAVLVDNQPASLVFYGEAPGLVSGVMQVNFVVPTTARSGPVSLVVSVGGNSSQQGVTIAVQ